MRPKLFLLAGRRPRNLLPFVLPLLSTLAAPLLPRALADNIMRVEEDWELVLNEPNSDTTVPQFHTVMSPNNTTVGAYAQVSWNYHELPNFAGGGLQIQAWKSGEDYDLKDIGETSLSNDAETITWTQALETDDHQLTFKIVDGQSQSWGEFGGDAMSIVVLPVSVNNLNKYTSAVSKSSSWITYGMNRVSLLQIKEVRKYDADGHLLSRDTTPKVIYQTPEE